MVNSFFKPYEFALNSGPLPFNFERVFLCMRERQQSESDSVVFCSMRDRVSVFHYFAHYLATLKALIEGERERWACHFLFFCADSLSLAPAFQNLFQKTFVEH